MPLLAAFITVVLWSFAFPASKAVLPYFSVEQIVLFRYLVASLFYVLVFLFGGFSLPKKKDLIPIAALALLGVTVYQLCFVFSLQRITAGAASMIITANPVVASLLAWVFLKERLSSLSWAGIAISFCGVVIISVVKGTGGELVGYLVLMIAVVSIAIFFVFQKPFFTRYTPLAMTSYTSIIGTIPLLYLLPDAIGPAKSAPLSAWFSIIGMGVLSSGVGFLLWFYALSKLPAGIVTSFLFLQPVFVTTIAWYWLEELPSLMTFVGGIVVLFGVSLILINQRRMGKSKPD